MHCERMKPYFRHMRHIFLTIGDRSGSGKVAGEGRKEEVGSQKTSSEDTGGRTQPSGCKQGPLGGCLFLPSQVTCLRESCMRENRTCSLGGGRRPPRKRASSDPTVRMEWTSVVTQFR